MKHRKSVAKKNRAGKNHAACTCKLEKRRGLDKAKYRAVVE